MLTVPFLTQLDKRAEIKGSRDPLGVQSIWTHFGRHVVGNLTTVSTSVRDFTTLLLGYYFAERLAEEAPGSELTTFLKWEQLAAYARAAINKERGFRGTERVHKALSERDRVFISDKQTSQILANQKIYGLWGLYTWPAKSSGLLEGEPTRLTEPARSFVEQQYSTLLGTEGNARTRKRIESLLRQPRSSLDVEGGDSDLLEAIAQVLKPRLSVRERQVFRDHLLFGGMEDSTEGRQRRLADLLKDTPGADFAWSPQVLMQLEKRCQAEGDQDLESRLRRIRLCESLIAPSGALFVHLLGLDGKSVDTAVARLRKQWGERTALHALDEIRELEGEFGGGDATTGRRWIGIAEATANGNYRELIELLVQQNRAVMDARGSAAWIELRNEQFHVRFQEERGELPSRAELPGMWRYSYFIDSLRTMTLQIEGAA